MIDIFLLDCKNHKIPVKKGKVITSFETLDGETLGKLDTIISGMGYTRIKQRIDKRYGDKYVWLKNKI